MSRAPRSHIHAVLAAAVVGLVALPTVASAATITVTGAGDSINDQGLCSLREAITNANANTALNPSPGECAAGDAAPVVDRIGFSLGANLVIDPNSALPSIDEVVEIDGSTQPGGDEVQLDGSSAGGDVPGLDVAASDTVVSGLTIVDWLAGTTTPGIGIRVDATAAGVAIRDNVVSGNSSGVRVEGDRAELTGNLIGTDSTGMAAYPNPTVNASGILIANGAGTQIGGSAPGDRNVISGNDGIGINLAGSDARVEGNYIGTDASGSGALGNGNGGVVISDAENVVGSTGAGNVISGNDDSGVSVSGASNRDNIVQANLIGVAADGSSPLGNETGISLSQTADNVIGGAGEGEGNVIAHSTAGPGIALSGSTLDGNTTLANSIHSNAELGIDLERDGVTSNDPGDADSGPNDLQNFPELAAAQSNSVDTTVQATLDSMPNRAYRVELFSNPACDDSGNGEGRLFLGARDIHTNSAGIALFSATVDPSTVGDHLAATATDLDTGDTSEFSACVEVDSKPEPPPPPPPSPPPAADPPDTEIVLEVDAKDRQRVGKLKLDVSCGSEPCEVEASGKAVAKKKRSGNNRSASAAAKKKTYKLKPAATSLAAGEERTLRLKLKQHGKSVKKLRKLLKAKSYRKRSKAKVDVAAADEMGNTATEKVKVKLRR